MTRAEFLSFSMPDVGQAEIDAVSEVLRSGWLTSGPRATAFEEAFAEFVGAPSALACNSWTGAAHAALHALGVGPGDEVIVPTMTFAATANIVEHVGARPVLVDVEPDSLNISVDACEHALTSRTRAIIPVHFSGLPVAMSRLDEIAHRHDLLLLEDAAHALPAWHDGHLVGGSGHVAAFSFYATKNLTTGEGGMVVGPADCIARARSFALHGMTRAAWSRYDKGASWRYAVEEPGFKYNMSDIQAAMGLVQLGRLTEMHERRSAVVARYDEALHDVEWISRAEQPSDVRSAHHLYVVRISETAFPGGRDTFVRDMADRNIGTSVHFIPLHEHPYYRDKYELREDDFPEASAAGREIVSLPLSSAMSDRDVEDVIEAILDIDRTCA